MSMMEPARASGAGTADVEHGPRPVQDTDAVIAAVARGDTDPDHGHQLVESLATTPDPAHVEAVVDAFRGWTWRSVTDRVRDVILLAEWRHVLRRAEALVRADHPETAGRLLLMSDLLRQSIQMAEAVPAESVLNRKHVAEILLLLHASKTPVPRSVVMEKYRIQDQNLTRVTRVMQEAGLIEQRPHGRETRIAIAARGRQYARQLQPASCPPTPETPPTVATPDLLQSITRGYQIVPERLPSRGPVRRAG